MKRLLSIILALALLFIISVVPTGVHAQQLAMVDRIYEGAVKDYNMNTPETYIFKTEGSDKEFILLDDENGFFVLAKDAYGVRVFDPDSTQKFDITDRNNIAYWLNGEFLEKGNGSVQLKLPDEIIRYVDKQREWDVEAGTAGGNCPEGYSVKAGVALLSQTEWKKYYHKFGLRDEIGIKGWWLRTPRGINGGPDTILVSSTVQASLGQTVHASSNTSTDMYVRPVFYLTNDFFKEVKVDLNQTGGEVIKAFQRHFTAEELSGIYTDKEIRDMGIEIPFAIQLKTPDVQISEDVQKAEYGTFLSEGSNRNKIIQGEEEQYIYGAFASNIKRNYQLQINISCNNVIGQSVVLEQIAVDGHGVELAKKTLLMMGENKKQRDYAINITDLPEKTEFVIFRLNISKGKGGMVEFGGWSVKRIVTDAKIIQNWAPMYVLSPNDQYSVELKTDILAPMTYTATYSLAYRGRDYTDQRSQKLYMTKPKQTFTVDMNDMKKGSAVLTIEVKLEQCVVASLRQEICVMEDYDWSKYNGLPRHSMNVGVDSIESTKGTIFDMVKRAGFNHVRMGISWTRVERDTKGNYLYDISDTFMNYIYKRDMDTILLLAFSSPLYNSGDVRIGPVTPEAVEGYLEYTRHLLERYPKISKIEIWNEPNNVGFWRPDGSVYAYANLVKAVSNLVRQINPEIEIFAGAIDISKKGVEWTNKLFDQGIYPYVDALSTHPYYHTALNDERYVTGVEKYTNIMEEYGGWKDVRLTEVGWTTYNKYELETTLASEEVKILAHSDYMDTTSDIFNFLDTTEAFGMLNIDYSAKPSYASVTNFNNETNGATPLTKLDINNKCHTFLYKKEGKPMIISWCHAGEDTTIDLPGKDVRVYDMYGNLVSKGNNVPQNDEPYYIYGVDGSLFAAGMSERIMTDYDLFSERYSRNIPEEFKNIIADMRLKTAKLGQMNGDEVEALISMHYENGITLMKSMDSFSAQNTNMMHVYHKIGLEMADFLMTIDNIARFDSMDRVEKLNQAYFEGKEDVADEKTFTRELLRHAKRYTGYMQIAKENHKVDRKNIAAWNLIANKLCDWEEYVNQVEQTQNLGLYFNIQPSSIDVYEGENVSFTATLYNKTDQNEFGQLEVLDGTGAVVDTRDVTIETGGKTGIDLSYEIKSEKQFGEDWNILRFTGQNAQYQLKLPVHMKTKVTASLDASTIPFEKMTALSVTLKNESNLTVDGVLKIVPPQGWSLASSQKNYHIDPQGTAVISYPLISKQKTPFHYYNFGIKVFDSDNKVLQNKEQPLDFSVVVKEDRPVSTEEFGGELSDWSNAYPTYLNPPGDPDLMEAWQSSEIAARIFTKWDEHYFYVMGDVYDSYHNQQNPKERLYAGDSIQLAIDATNTKSKAYDEDDYEYGFALDNLGNTMAYAWKVPLEQVSGEKPSEWCKIVRNEATKNTRYFIKIPRENISPMEMKEGNIIGMNLLLNDANLLGNRDNAIEITGGINSKKDPSQYRNWIFTNAEERTSNNWDKVAGIFIPTFDASLIVGFNDIWGHWAEESIRSAVKQSLVKGTSAASFEPDTALTVAEALQLIKNVYHLPDADYQNEFTDVSSDAWYAGAVAGVLKAGKLPEEMVNQGHLMPERLITREEFAEIIAKGEENSSGGMPPFADWDQVSQWAKDAVNTVFEKGYMEGNGGYFLPDQPLTRAEAAVVILKISESVV